jgi:hypothetical protein
MSLNVKKQLDELVGGDVFAGGGDRNVTNDSEIETGPVQKPYNDDSDYEKGMSTTTDKVFGRYRQNIPWFAVYSFGGTRGALPINNPLNEKTKILKKTQVEEKIEDLVKKSNNYEVTDKNYNPKFKNILTKLNDVNLSKTELDELKNLLLKMEKDLDKPKNI